MEEINFKEKRKIKISSGREEQTLEIGKNIIDNGFLNKLNGSALAIFIYLATHFRNDKYCQINLSKMINKIPYNINQIQDGIETLKKNNFIKINEYNSQKLTYKFLFNPHNHNTPHLNDKIMPPQNGASYRKDIIQKSNISKKQLIKALLSFIPPDKNPDSFRSEINKWLNDFEPSLLQELIRRVDKWLSKHSRSSIREAFYYLKGIINDWYKKEIFTFKKLKYFDRLFRETRELAKTYGIKWRNITPAQLETFKAWLTEEFALSKSVVKFAIQEATRRKSNGQPSLKYIEDNFIIPWKQAEIKNIQEAKKQLNTAQNNKNYRKKSNKKYQETVRKDWDNFYWDFN